MGLAASQARLLSLTARIHDVEYQAQMIQNSKLQLATQEDQVYKNYTDALDATTLTFQDPQGNRIPANFNNLCGEASITNGINKHYVFRTGSDDRLIVPNDVYEGYIAYGGDDPYEFAMVMMGVDVDSYEDAKDKFYLNRSESGFGNDLESLNEAMEDKVKAIATAAGHTNPEEAVNDYKEGESIINLLPNKNDSNYAKVKAMIDEFNELEEEFTYKLFQKGGAENIYELATGNADEFDQDRFNYYVRWGMLIKQEIGIEYCVTDKDYADNFANDSDALNSMLESGRILVGTIDIDKKGHLNEDSTSVSADSTLEFTNTSSIDKKALAKAEAEYEYAMKQIDRKDKQFDMDLSKLETERNALTTEYDSVKKVIDDNIKRTFGIFS